MSSQIMLTCMNCYSAFYRSVSDHNRSVQKSIARGKESETFCSRKCKSEFYCKSVTTSCGVCNKSLKIKHKDFKKSKSGKVFCSRSCSAKYNNTHKLIGNRRSKLEHYIELELSKLFPDLLIQYNSKDQINSELDIFIPKFKLAFELNGIFHYEPIYGSDKLEKIQSNDDRKFQACLEKDIELCIIDVSSQKYFKEQTSKSFLKIIVDLIKFKINAAERT